VTSRLAVVLVAALCAGAAGAQQPASVDAAVDRPVIHDNESFTYTVRAEGSVRGEPELGPIKQQFDVLASSSEKRIGIVNGRTSEVTTWTYELMPKRAGEFTLPPVRVGALQTNAVTLRVTPQPTRSAAPADVFIELEAQPSIVYAQSQVVLTLRLFVGVNTGRATLTQPEIAGGEAIVEKLGEDTNYSTERAGRVFSVRERRYAIFPQQAGTLTVGPATFEAMVIPDRGFSRVARFRSSTLDLAVRPAVPPPASMAGAAWLPAQRVTLSEHWNDDSPELTVGIPRTRQITVEADGLLETQLPELALPQPPGLRQYADQPELSHELTPLGIKSKRTVSMAVIAQTPGAITLPRVALPWWNVKTQAWEVAELPERTLKIAPSAEAPTQVTQAERPPAAAAASAPPGALWPLVSGALALGWLATALAWWRSVATRGRVVRGSRAMAQGLNERRPNERKLLRDVQAACDASDADAARRALLAWAEAHFPDPPRSLGALASAVPEPAAREILALEALIYGVTPGGWDGRALAATLHALDTARGPVAAGGKDEPLLPLYR